MYHLIPLQDIQFDDSTRHRKSLDGIEELVASIKKIREINPVSMGLLNPIILGDGNILLAGRRRLEAFKTLGDAVIPARYFNDLAKHEQKLIELDENLRRVDITWQERVLAVFELHSLINSESASQTAEYIGLSPSVVSRYLQVAETLRAGDVKVAACSSAEQAITIVQRRRTQALDDELSKIHETTKLKPMADGHTEPMRAENQIIEPLAKPRPQYEILNADFLKWAPAYAGPKFNFIHCDFPYGIDINDSAAAGSATEDTQYDDSEELFFNLTHCLTENIDTLMYDSGHILFWFHMKYYQRLVDHFRAAGLFVIDLPLIWFKSDNLGIASDYRRRPKHVYETALFMSRGDRFISNVVNDTYPCPTARSQEKHMSAKPFPMLKHFFSMMVNNLSSVLDPTCGSGTSIRAAASLAAERAVGLEINPTTASAASEKLSAFLRLASAANIAAGKATDISL